MDKSVGPHAVIIIRRGAAVIDQSYLQCHFFGPKTKDRDMHKKKPPSGRVYRIGEAARLLDLQTSVLRFWEGEFPELQPVRTPKGQRVYTEKDMDLLRKIRSLLHEQGMTIEGARRILSGVAMPAMAQPAPAAPSAEAIPGEVSALLKDTLDELRRLREMLTIETAKEGRS